MTNLETHEIRGITGKIAAWVVGGTAMTCFTIMGAYFGIKYEMSTQRIQTEKNTRDISDNTNEINAQKTDITQLKEWRSLVTAYYIPKKESNQ